MLNRYLNTTGNGLNFHQWRAVIDHEGCWTGKVVVQLMTTAEITVLHQRLHGQGVRIQDHVASIGVEALHLDLDSRAAGGRQSS